MHKFLLNRVVQPSDPRKRHKLSRLVERGPAILRVFGIQSHGLATVYVGHERRDDGDVVLRGLIELLREVGRVQTPNSQPGFLGDLSKRSLPRSFPGFDATGDVAPRVVEMNLCSSQEQKSRSRRCVFQNDGRCHLTDNRNHHVWMLSGSRQLAGGSEASPAWRLVAGDRLLRHVIGTPIGQR